MPPFNALRIIKCTLPLKSFRWEVVEGETRKMRLLCWLLESKESRMGAKLRQPHRVE